MIESTRRQHGRRAVAIEREKPDARHPIIVNVSAHVQLVHRAQARNCGHERWECSDVPHSERNYSDPRSTIESIDLQSFRNQRSQFLFLDPPMHEKQFAPTLMYQGLSIRALADRSSFQFSKMFLFAQDSITLQLITAIVSVLLRRIAESG